MDEAQFTITLVVNGVLIGMMYALIALGFVLVYKATEAINFAQGEFVMIAGFMVAVLAAAGGMPFWLAVVGAVVLMTIFGFLLERLMLRALIGRPVIAMIMATIGLATVLRGLAPLLFGAETRSISLPVSDEPMGIGWLSLPPVQLAGAGASLAFLCFFSVLFLKSRMGIAMRAVADDQRTAMAMGINVQRYFAIVWGFGGIVAALGGVAWGALLGVDVHLALIGLKVFPVVILGGLDSIVGAIVGGLVVGVAENLAGGHLDPLVGGGTKDFVPYILMILMLMVRPYGLFGKRRVERI